MLAGILPPPGGNSLVPALPEKAYSNLVAQAEAGLALAAEEFEATTEIIEASSAAGGLAELTEDIEGDLLVLGSSGTNTGRIHAGHTARVLMQESTSAVALTPVGYRNNPGRLSRIGAAVVGQAGAGSKPEGTTESERALQAAVDVAGTDHSVRIITVAGDSSETWGFWGATLALADLSEAARTLAEDVLKVARSSVPEGVTVETALLEGKAAEQLSRQTAADLDMLCVGSRHYGPLRRVLLGSVSSQLLHDASCPVMVLPRY